MYLPTLPIFLTLATLLSTAAAVPTATLSTDAINLSDRNALFSRALEGLKVTHLTDSSSLHRRTWPLWGHKSGKDCDCEEGSGSSSDTESGGESESGSGSADAGAGAEAGAGGSGKRRHLL